MKVRLCVLLLAATFLISSVVANGADPTQSVQRLTEFRRFDGEWRVKSAGFQMSGPITYTFSHGTLTIETSSIANLKNGGDGPVTVRKEGYRYEVDPSRLPKRIVLKPIEDDVGKEKKNIYEFRDGMLWMCPDDATSKSLAALKNDRFGDGWLIGLAPITK